MPVALKTGFGKDQQLARDRNVKRAEQGLHDLAVGAVKFQFTGDKFCPQMRDNIVR